MLQAKFTAAAVSLLLLASFSTVQAAPVEYFGENQALLQSVVGPPAEARKAFLARLTNTVQSEDFEGFSDGAKPPLALSFTGSAGELKGTLTSQDSRDGVYSGFFEGRFNTTPLGAQYWETVLSFAIDFETPISAFGFYGTDIGDFSGRITVSLTDTSANITTLSIGHTVNGATLGSSLFWGFVDETTSYTRVSFSNTAAASCMADPLDCDAFGFDDMVIGDRSQIITVTPPPNGVPLPGTLALAGLALAAMGALRRKA